jgi:hypothetical protein
MQEITAGLWRILDEGIDGRWELWKVLKLVKVPYKEHVVCFAALSWKYIGILCF